MLDKSNVVSAQPEMLETVKSDVLSLYTTNPANWKNFAILCSVLLLFSSESGIIFARFFGKCKQVFVRDFELDDFLDELDKKFQ